MLVFDEKKKSYEKKYKNIQEKTRNAIFTILEYRTLMFNKKKKKKKKNYSRKSKTHKTKQTSIYK